MKAFENFQADKIDDVVLHAQQALIDVINQVTAIKHGPVSQKVFVLLCNDLEHIKQQIFQQDVTKFTVAQKKVFLQKTVADCPEGVFSAEEKKEFLNNLENLSDQELSTKTKKLQTKIEEFFAATKLQIAKNHAKVIGQKVKEIYSSLEQQVSESFSKINWDEAKNTEEKQKKIEIFTVEQAKIIENVKNLVSTLQVLQEHGAKEKVFGEFKNALSIEIQNHVATDLNQATTDSLKTNMATAFAAKIKQIVDGQVAEKVAALKLKNAANLHLQGKEETINRQQIAADFEKDLANMAVSLKEVVERQEITETQEEEKRLLTAQKQFDTCVNMAINDADVNNVVIAKQAVQSTIETFTKSEESSTHLGTYVSEQFQTQLEVLGVQQDKLIFKTKDAAYAVLGDIEFAYQAKQEDSKRKALEVLEKVALVAGFLENVKESTNIDLYVKRIANDTTHAIRAILEPLRKTATLGSSRFF